jgi:hypothetical protein
MGVLATGTAGGTIALRTWDTDKTPEGEKAQWQFRTLRTLKCRPDCGFTSSVTALRFIGQVQGFSIVLINVNELLIVNVCTLVKITAKCIPGSCPSKCTNSYVGP